MLSASPRRGSWPAGQILGAADRYEPESAMAAARQAHRGPRAAHADLRLVYRRLRHRRPPGGQDADGGARTGTALAALKRRTAREGIQILSWGTQTGAERIVC